METEIIVRLHKNFEEHAHKKDGVEFWYARELQFLLGYTEWRNFEKTIEKAKIACKNVKQNIDDHFVDSNKTIEMPKGANKEILDIMLTRYACYLIAQNGDSKKEEIAFAMSYFAVQTRKQEIIQQRILDWERVQSRKKLSLTEKALSGVLFERGIDSQGFARIRSKGDEALFGGNTTQKMKEMLDVPETRPLADFLPDIIIKAKDFASEITRKTVANDKSIVGENRITAEHIDNNQNARDMLIKKNFYPERLPREEDIKKIDRKLKSEGKKLPKTTQKLK